MTATGAASGVLLPGLGLERTGDWAAQFEKSHERKRIKFHGSRDPGIARVHSGAGGLWLVGGAPSPDQTSPAVSHLQGICFALQALQAFADSERHGQTAPELLPLAGVSFLGR